jgi:hypothetical protein
MADEAAPGLLQVVSQCHALLNALDPPIRTKAIKILLLAFDETDEVLGDVGADPAQPRSDREESATAGDLNRRTQSWLKKHSLSRETLDQVFDSDNNFALIGHLPGSSKREQTTFCYLLVGLQAMLRHGEPKFRDEDAVALCKSEGCFDRANHAATRAQLGKRVTGDKEAFTLTSLGLDQAAAIVQQIAAT